MLNYCFLYYRSKPTAGIVYVKDFNSTNYTAWRYHLKDHQIFCLYVAHKKAQKQRKEKKKKKKKAKKIFRTILSEIFLEIRCSISLYLIIVKLPVLKQLKLPLLHQFPGGESSAILCKTIECSAQGSLNDSFYVMVHAEVTQSSVQ